MSWMDSWSRPSKHTATPPPFYSLPGGEGTPYCHTCGRVIGSRKLQTSKSSKDKVKYCSERCRHQKPGEADRAIEHTFVSLLNGEHPKIDSSAELSSTASPQKTTKSSTSVKKVKGESRITVLCSMVEELVFGSRYDPEKVYGRKRNRAKRGVPESGDWKSVDMEDCAPQVYEDYSMNQSDDERQDNKVTLQGSQKFPVSTSAEGTLSDRSGANSHAESGQGWRGKTEEDAELKQKREEGQRRAEEREAVRCAARRLCAFGVYVPAQAAQGITGRGSGTARRRQKTRETADLADHSSGESAEHTEKRRKCEAVTKDGTVVESSFAKGEWGIRWRE